MEQGCSRLEDFPLNVFSVTPYTPHTADIQVSDDDKAGATLLFSGIFLGLVGVTFTIMGWIKYQGSPFEWTQLLGPILLSVGVTFILIAVCKFKMLSCQWCKKVRRGSRIRADGGRQSLCSLVSTNPSPSMAPLWCSIILLLMALKSLWG